MYVDAESGRRIALLAAYLGDLELKLKLEATTIVVRPEAILSGYLLRGLHPKTNMLNSFRKNERRPRRKPERELTTLGGQCANACHLTSALPFLISPFSVPLAAFSIRSRSQQ